MAVIVETGEIVLGANSYVDEAELTLYATDRGITITGDETQLLVQAMDYVESLSFIGIKHTDTQDLQWPRSGAVVDDYLVSSNAIPAELKKGQIEVALAIDAGNGPLTDIARQKSSVKVGELAVTYQSGQSTTIVRKISASLYKLLVSGVDGISFSVSRG